jgi:hypothetical protein
VIIAADYSQIELRKSTNGWSNNFKASSLVDGAPFGVFFFDSNPKPSSENKIC